jgi:hypothetical protein
MITSSSSSESLSELLLSDSASATGLFEEAAGFFAGSSSELLSSLLSELDSCLADCAAFFGWTITWKDLFRKLISEGSGNICLFYNNNTK